MLVYTDKTSKLIITHSAFSAPFLLVLSFVAMLSMFYAAKKKLSVLQIALEEILVHTEFERS